MIAKEIKHGSVTKRDWDALVRSMIHVSPIIMRRFENRKSALVVEIGTLSGRTTRGIMDVFHRLKVPAIVITVDQEASAMARWGVTAKAFKSDIVQTEFFHGNSADVVSRCLFKKAVAWAFVDGCHCMDCVLADIDALDKRMLPGGHICFHDAGDQRSRGMLVHERYHQGDGVERLYGVNEAIESSSSMKSYNLFCSVDPEPRPNGPTPVRGGLQVWEKE